MTSISEVFLRKRFGCCTRTIMCTIYNTVGWSIATIYDLGGIFTEAQYIASGNI